MKKAAMAARVGNRILSIMAGILILLMLSYGMYSLWDTYKIYANSFADEELLKFRPTDDGEDNPTLKDLKKLNPDVKAWIQVPKTNIDYPVVQGQDDMEYINKNVYGEFELSGAIFLSCLNKDDFSDPYNLVYGHNMKNGSMFAQLHKFEDPDFFDANREVVIYLPGEVLHYTIFAAHIYDDRHLLYSFDFTDPEVYQKYLDSIFSTRDMSANIDKDITVTTDDQIITLVTCIGSQPNNRLLVQAVLTDREPGTETARAAVATE